MPTSRSPAVSVPLKTTHFAFWLMLMNPPTPMILSPKRLTLTLPCAVDLGERQKREVQSAAVVEIELRRLLDHRGEVLRRRRSRDR